MSKELKPCPFCNGKAEIIKCYTFGKITGYFATCRKCDCELKIYTSKQNAEKAWNKRVCDEKLITVDIPIKLLEDNNDE